MSERITRRNHLERMMALAVAWGAGSLASCEGKARPARKDTFGLKEQGKKIPVIFDTDIGDDIDDTWALLMLLKSPELDVRLVAADGGAAVYRARILAKFLQAMGRSDIPVAVGLDAKDKAGRQSKWIEGYELNRYPGTVYQDGVAAIIDTVHRSPDPITLIGTGPVPNIAEALRRDARWCDNARFVGMHGSVRRGYDGSLKLSAEWNVRANPKALQAVFAAPWDVSITPLDTCGIIRLVGEKYARVSSSKARGVSELMENYQAWVLTDAKSKPDAPKASSVLFDTVAIYMAFSEELLGMETLPLRVTDEGMTVVEAGARPVHCALTWKDLAAYEDSLVARLIS